MSTVYFRDKTQSSESDTGTDIRPVSDGEVLEERVLNRPINNLKARTEELAKFADIRKTELRLEKSRHISLVEVGDSGEIEGPGMLRITRAGDSAPYTYFLSPGNIDDPNNTNDYRVVVTSGVENAGCYSITRAAFHSYYTDDSAGGYSTDRGLTRATDTVSLAVPRYSDTELTESQKNIPRAASSVATSLREASGNSAHTLHMVRQVTDSAQNAIIKTPRDNKIIASLNITSDTTLAFTQLLESALSDLTMTVTSSAGSSVSKSIDTSYISVSEYNSSEIYIYLEDFSDIGDLFDSADTVTFTTTDNDLSYEFSLNDGHAFSAGSGMSPPYDYLIPLFYHAGDRLVVSGVGSILTKEVDRIVSLGGQIMLRGDGKIVTNTVDGEIDYIYTQNRFVISDLGYSSTQNFSIPLFRDDSLETSYYQLEKVSIIDVISPTADIHLFISVRDSSASVITSILNPYWGVGVANPLSLTDIPKGSDIAVGDFSGRSTNEPLPGDVLSISFHHNTLGELINTASGIVVRLTYVKVVES